MKKFMSVCLSILALACFAQNSTNASGGEAAGSGGSSSYTVGQVDYTANSGSNGNVNQGVQQPYEFFTIGEDEYPEITLGISVYPNPTVTHVTLQIDSQTFENIRYQLTDVTGKLLAKEKVTETETTIATEDLASAIYFLVVTEKDLPIKSFQIIKNQ